MSFIPIEQMSKLREAAKQGDERAKKILQAYIKKQDYASDLDSYFQPAPNPAPAPVQNQEKAIFNTGNKKLDQFLIDNGIDSPNHPDYREAIKDYFNEFPNETMNQPEPELEQEQGLDSVEEFIQGIVELIKKSDGILLEVAQSEGMNDSTKKGAMITLQEIKQNLFEELEKLKKVQNSMKNKDEEQIPIE